MPILSCSPDSEVLTSAERWRRWEQRGREYDARFVERARRIFWSALIVGALISIGALLP